MSDLTSLTVACSTFGNRLMGAAEVYRSLRVCDLHCAFLILHQVPAGEHLNADTLRVQRDLQQCDDVIYIQSDSRGLTLSRNLAISACKTKFIWFMDDDIHFIPDIFPALALALDAGGFELLTLESLKSSGGKRTVYPLDTAILNSREILRVASFELIANCDYLKKCNAHFRTDMGVGSHGVAIMGEESVFLADLRQSGARLLHKSLPAVVHPDISTGVLVSDKNFYSKGLILRRCFSGRERVKFYCKDVVKLLKNRDGQFGRLLCRLRLIRWLTSGCFL